MGRDHSDGSMRAGARHSSGALRAHPPPPPAAPVQVFVRESSMVPVYSLLLFGGALEVHHEKGLLTVDGWAQFKAPGRIGVLVRELRAQVGGLTPPPLPPRPLQSCGRR
jgi:hypothetical protein